VCIFSLVVIHDGHRDTERAGCVSHVRGDTADDMVVDCDLLIAILSFVCFKSTMVTI